MPQVRLRQRSRTRQTGRAGFSDNDAAVRHPRAAALLFLRRFSKGRVFAGQQGLVGQQGLPGGAGLVRRAGSARSASSAKCPSPPPPGWERRGVGSGLRGAREGGEHETPRRQGPCRPSQGGSRTGRTRIRVGDKSGQPELIGRLNPDTAALFEADAPANAPDGAPVGETAMAAGLMNPPPGPDAGRSPAAGHPVDVRKRAVKSSPTDGVPQPRMPPCAGRNCRHPRRGTRPPDRPPAPCAKFVQSLRIAF